MLSKEDTRKTLEGVIASQPYKDANDIMALLKATTKYLDTLSSEIKFREEYKATYLDYPVVEQFFDLVISEYVAGDIISALRTMKMALVDGSGHLALKRDTLFEGTALFRMRSQQRYKLLKRDEMFHIPTDKVQKVQNYRYSLNGFPCLYLGASLYVCWEETRRPDIDKVNYVKMVPTKDIPVVSTLCPETFNDVNDVIQFYVFALCTKMADNDKEKFQFQYAFPELLLHLLINCMQSGDEAWGIKYVSARYFENDGKFSSEPLFYNYVIPRRGQIDPKDHLSVELKSTFKVSDVHAYYENRVYENHLPTMLTRPNEYANTHFMLLEKDLRAIKTLNFK